MRRHARRFAVLLASAALAGAASSASAGLQPFQATLSIQVATLAPLTLPGAGIATINGSGGGGHLTALALPAGALATTGFILPITDPAAFPLQGILLTAANASGSFASGGGALGGAMALPGVAKICLFLPCSAAIANLSVPLGVIGLGGTTTATAVVNVTVQGGPWTTGTVPVGTFSLAGFAHGPLSATSSTAAQSGMVRLVTPVFVQTNIGSFLYVPLGVSLDLRFVPEPGTMLLLATGFAGLALAGRRARRS